MRVFNIAAIAGLCSIPRALAWGAAGHEIVATIAQSLLEPQALNAVCSILASEADSGVRVDAPCYLSKVATWADKIRYDAKWSAPLHYVGATGDHPPDNCLFPGSDGWDGRPRGNVLDAIQNVTSILSNFVSTSGSTASADARAQEALKFLIHFVGDMHQPLHLTGRDRGANGVKVTFGGRETNLHTVWDDWLIAKSLRTIPRNYTRPLPVPALESSLRGAIYDPYVRRIVWDGVGVGRGTGRWESEADSWFACPAPSLSSSEPQFVLAAPLRPSYRGAAGPPQTSDSDTLCPYAWVAPIHQLNCDFVWPVGDYPELDTPEYAGRIASDWVIEKLLAQGGVRLAGILNALFSP